MISMKQMLHFDFNLAGLEGGSVIEYLWSMCEALEVWALALGGGREEESNLMLRIYPVIEHLFSTYTALDLILSTKKAVFKFQKELKQYEYSLNI